MAPKFPHVACLVLGLASAVAVADELPVHKLTAKDGRFEPSTLEVAAGQKFRVEVVNAGSSAIEFESKPLRKEKVIAAGARATIDFQPLKAGSYRFFDEFHEKTGQGEIVAR